MYGIPIRTLRALPCALAIILVGVSSSVAAAAQPGSQDIEPSLQQKVDAAVEQVLKRTGVPSVSIALVRDNRLIYARAYGDARLNPRTQAAPSMRYAVGSISKEFTASALLLLQQDRRVSLDDPAGKYLDHLGPAAGVTIRQLLSHTSGVRDFWPQDYFLQDMLQPASAADIIGRWGAKPLDFAPGSAWQYSNTGYTIAGAIAEKVSGHRLFEQLAVEFGFEMLDQVLTRLDAAEQAADLAVAAAQPRPLPALDEIAPGVVRQSFQPGAKTTSGVVGELT
jgi:D-alanyl-D-alanine carboxypeptidase